MPSPNFFIIGAPKCGTETIETWLSGHPEVFFPKNPLANYYATDLEERIEDPAYWRASYAQAKAPAIGECAPWYLYSEDAIPAILTDQPEARFIVCLRNPIDMAWVLHSANVADARDHISDFSTAWAMSAMRGQGRGARLGTDPKTLDYAAVCALGTQLLRLTALVEPDQIHLVFLDDVQERPAEVWRDLQAFLEISETSRDTFPIEDFLIERPLPGLHVLLRVLGDTRNAVLPQRFLRIGLQRSVNGWNRRAGTLKEMPRDLRKKVCDRLSGDVGIISAMSGRDLSGWIC